jgi:class 3 adenylate cyclase
MQTAETCCHYASFVPSIVLQHINRKNGESLEPHSEEIEGVVIIADMSGFTKLSEHLAQGNMNAEKGGLLKGNNSGLSAVGATARLFRLSNKSEQESHGAEKLRACLNSYFGKLITIIEHARGDVIRVAGDAVIALFQIPQGSSLAGELLRACACSCKCIQLLHNTNVLGITLGLHVGIGAGPLRLMHVGGFNDSWQMVMCGPPLQQIETALDDSKTGEVVISTTAFGILKKLEGLSSLQISDASTIMAAATPTRRNNLLLSDDPPPPKTDKRPPNRRPSFVKSASMSAASTGEGGEEYQREVILNCPANCRRIVQGVRAYAPLPVIALREAASAAISGFGTGKSGAGMQSLHGDDTGSLAEVRRLTVLFLLISGWNTNGSEGVTEDSFMSLHLIFRDMQQVLHDHDGVVKELSVDDKGCVLVAGFGVPPVVGQRLPGVAACLAGLQMLAALQRRGCAGCIGIATGQVFCASLGSKVRREFALVSSTVNLAARLMCVVAKSLKHSLPMSKYQAIDTSAEDVGTSSDPKKSVGSGAAATGMGPAAAAPTHRRVAGSGPSPKNKAPPLRGGLLVEGMTYRDCWDSLHFELLDATRLKGFSEPQAVFRPVAGGSNSTGSHGPDNKGKHGDGKDDEMDSDDEENGDGKHTMWDFDRTRAETAFQLGVTYVEPTLANIIWIKTHGRPKYVRAMTQMMVDEAIGSPFDVDPKSGGASSPTEDSATDIDAAAPAEAAETEAAASAAAAAAEAEAAEAAAWHQRDGIRLDGFTNVSALAEAAPVQHSLDMLQPPTAPPTTAAAPTSPDPRHRRWSTQGKREWRLPPSFHSVLSFASRVPPQLRLELLRKIDLLPRAQQLLLRTCAAMGIHGTVSMLVGVLTSKIVRNKKHRDVTQIELAREDIETTMPPPAADAENGREDVASPPLTAADVDVMQVQSLEGMIAPWPKRRSPKSGRVQQLFTKGKLGGAGVSLFGRKASEEAASSLSGTASSPHRRRASSPHSVLSGAAATKCDPYGQLPDGSDADVMALQTKMLRRHFDQLDLDHGGTLTARELLMTLHAEASAERAATEAATEAATANRNENAVSSHPGLKGWLCTMIGLDLKQNCDPHTQLDEMFAMADIDEDMEIGWEEFQSWFFYRSNQIKLSSVGGLEQMRRMTAIGMDAEKVAQKAEEEFAARKVEEDEEEAAWQQQQRKQLEAEHRMLDEQLDGNIEVLSLGTSCPADIYRDLKALAKEGFIVLRPRDGSSVGLMLQDLDGQGEGAGIASRARSGHVEHKNNEGLNKKGSKRQLKRRYSYNAGSADALACERMEKLDYCIPDLMVAELAYGNLPFQQRKMLHTYAAKWHKAHGKESGQLGAVMPWAIHHYMLAGEEEKAMSQMQLLHVLGGGKRFLEEWVLAHTRDHVRQQAELFGDKEHFAGATAASGTDDAFDVLDLALSQTERLKKAVNAVRRRSFKVAPAVEDTVAKIPEELDAAEVSGFDQRFTH